MSAFGANHNVLGAARKGCKTREAHDFRRGSRHFDYWERYTQEGRERINAAFPLDAFPPAESIFKQAAEAAATDAEAAARVEFLRKGLEHAKLCVRVAAQVSAARPEAAADVTSKSLDELIAFRHRTERDGIANFSALAWSEGSGWRVPEAYR